MSTRCDACVALEARIAEIEKTLSAIRAVFTGKAAFQIEPATDDELDGKYGDPTVRKDPTARYWKGESHRGIRYSRCPPDFLDAMVRYKLACSFMSKKNAETAEDPKKKADLQKYAGYDTRDASYAAGWARRLREGWLPPPEESFDQSASGYGSAEPDPFASQATTAAEPVGDDEIPF